MKYLLIITFFTSIFLYLRWYKLPIINLLKKDLYNTEIDVNGKKVTLGKLACDNFSVENISNSPYKNIYREYRVGGRKFVYKALGKEVNFPFYKTFIVTASEVDEQSIN